MINEPVSDLYLAILYLIIFLFSLAGIIAVGLICFFIKDVVKNWYKTKYFKGD